MRPDAFAAVMATGIVSVAADDHGVDVVGVPLAVVAILALPFLAYLTAVAWQRDSWRLSDLDTAIGLLTYVAACCVLATRFDSYRVVVLVLGGLALQGWLSLAPFVVRGMWRLGPRGLRDQARGAWELASVASSGLAITSVAAGIVFWALVFWALALVAYLVMTALILLRAAHDPAVRHDVPPDHWILMGGLAIATLAGVHVHGALHPGPIADAIRLVTIVTWVLASLWIVPLAVVGWRRIRGWPAVFPLGMYSSATFAVAGETRWAWMTGVSTAFFWLALALWLLTLLRFVHPRPRSPRVTVHEPRAQPPR
jgi:voltage-gated anion channel